ncbi:MAG: glycosyltransferase family 4 protein [Anaerolineae bacterium]
MLIGIDASRAVARERTGTENYSLQLIRHLLALDANHRYRLYFNQPPRPNLFPPSARAESRVMPFPRLWTHLRLSWEIARRSPDILFVPAHVLPLIHPRRSVVTVHDLGYLYYPRAHRPFDRWYLHWSTFYHVRAACHLIADSQATRDDLIRHYRAVPERVTVVYPGCDEIFRPVTDANRLARVKKRYGFRGDYVLHVGTLQPRKNLERLLEAFAHLDGELQLVLAGKRGWLYDRIFRRVEELGLGDRVLFAGHVPQEDLPALMSGARLLAMPSLYEGFGLPVVEAMACGTPVVCSNASSLPEVAGDAALLVDPLDVEGMAAAMERVLGDDELRAELIERGFERAKKFSWERCARQTLAVLEKAGGLLGGEEEGVRGQDVHEDGDAGDDAGGGG